MRRTRWLILLLLVCSTGLLGISTARPVAASGIWLPTGPVIVNRANHTATLLPNGQVLIVGGGRGSDGGGELLGAGERYDPATNRWIFSGNMRYARIGHTATTLTDGRVLVIGGQATLNEDGPPRGGGISPTTEIYDPATDRWTQGVSLGTPRAYHSATLLSDGRVLIVGGLTATAAESTPTPLATTELYDPRTNSWSPGGVLATGRALHAAVRLPNGEVIAIGGNTSAVYNAPAIAEVERYNPATNQWRAGRSLPTTDNLAAATLLADGRILAVGYGQAAIVLLYDPNADGWVTGAAPGVKIAPDTATPLPNGQVLVIGGRNYAVAGEQGLAALYDPATDTWGALPNTRTFRQGHTATALADGRVLIAGGGIDPIAEVYVDNGAGAQCFPETGRCLNGRFLAYWLAHGGLAVNGYPLTGEFTETLEDGKPYLVQYFERVRLEYHPENAAPYDVLLGQFGRQIHPADPAVEPKPQDTFFPQTGHNLRNGLFRDYWQEHGGLEQFGYPITEVFRERLEDGQEYEVQYFERARFEFHSMNKPPYTLLLGQFGRRIMTERNIQP